MLWFMNIGLVLLPGFPLQEDAGGEGAINLGDAEHLVACVQGFMDEYELPGLALAVARKDELVFNYGFGWADLKEQIPVETDSLFRIASVSKPITAVGVLKLVEAEELALDDRLFGKDGLLAGSFRKHRGRAAEVTVEQLLRHTAGEPWGNSGSDPMFRWDISGAELIRKVLLEVPLEAEPGSVYSYSNFGYCLLGRVIEQVTGEDYDEWILENVLEPCGAGSMQIGTRRKRQRPDREVTYYDAEGDVAPEFGIARMDAHGGWIATAEDLVRFAMAVDGRDAPDELLREATRAAMLRPTFEDNGYAMGWAVNRYGNHWHTGSLPGTASMLGVTQDGTCWAILVNKRPDAAEFFGDLDALFWDIREGIPAWK
ncbi:MAG: serine hydrolase domain-containing protein [Planctomycetota bacterium]|jgi:CubicO group peptidase (beta-lactamase class C family)